MPRGELKINGRDAYAEWGISLDSKGLSALMTPAPLKDVIENESRLEHGSRTINTNPRKAARDISLPMHMHAHTEEAFLANYAAFCAILETGSLDIWTKYQPATHYKVLYKSCTQFQEYGRGIAKFVLRLYESNPGDRS